MTNVRSARESALHNDSAVRLLKAARRPLCLSSGTKSLPPAAGWAVHQRDDRVPADGVEFPRFRGHFGLPRVRWSR